MGEQCRRGALTAIVLVAVSSVDVSAQTVISHWSFDSSSLTLSGGNIMCAAEATGNHNAVTTQTTGSGAGSPYTSNAIPAANSVTGQFGQGLTLTGFNTVAGGGGQFLTFPNLTELMTAGSAAGAPSYSISYWLNTTTTNAQQYTILGDWGNSASNPGRFAYGYGIGFTGTTPQMRAQTRFNTSGTGNGTDIFAQSVSTATLNNGNWHMLTWTFNTSSGQLISYFDGAQVNSVTSGAGNFNMIASGSPVGTFGLKGDSGNFVNGTIALDEAWVVNGVLTPTQIQDGFTNNYANTFQTAATNLKLVVNIQTGTVTIQNATADPVAINSYRITSNSGALDATGWDPLATGTPIGGFPQGDGTGNGWEVAPNPSDKELVEWFLTGSSNISNGSIIPLGTATFPSLNAGDHDNNGVVDAADYVTWRNSSLPQFEYDNWKRNFGKRKGAQDLVFQYTLADGTVKTGTVSYDESSAGSGISSAAIPEPTTYGLLLIFTLLGIFGRHCRGIQWTSK